MRLELDCKEVSHILSAGQESKLGTAERARLRLHMVVCDACREVDQQFDFLRRAMRRLGPQDPPER